jgi:hypothetical protein
VNNTEPSVPGAQPKLYCAGATNRNPAGIVGRVVFSLISSVTLPFAWTTFGASDAGKLVKLILLNVPVSFAPWMSVLLVTPPE